jgi:hypothetical protein
MTVRPFCIIQKFTVSNYCDHRRAPAPGLSLRLTPLAGRPAGDADSVTSRGLYMAAPLTISEL